jgi:hypothetical protein
MVPLNRQNTAYWGGMKPGLNSQQNQPFKRVKLIPVLLAAGNADSDAEVARAAGIKAFCRETKCPTLWNTQIIY